VTGVTEANVRTFAGNWTGTGTITGSGDSEKVCLDPGEYMVSEVFQTGANIIVILQNEYSQGDYAVLKYRHGTTQSACEAASWNLYSGQFASLGYVQIRLEATT
jgi:hypothetical protein